MVHIASLQDVCFPTNTQHSACCYDDFPTNRMTYCDGDKIHFFCRGCLRKYTEAEMSQSRCRPKCMQGCGASFTRRQLQEHLDPRSFDRLERMQQLEEITAADLEDLGECPFCDFKAICPPIEVDREFRCQKPDCKRVSCRKCNKETHIPFSCEEYEKENKLTVRHAVEEAMSKALIRTCK